MPKLTIDIETRLAKFQDSLQGIQKDAEKAVSGIERAFSGLGSIRNVLTGGAIATFFTSAVKHAAEAEEANIRLAATLKATGNAAGLTKGQIDDLSESLAGFTQFSGGNIRGASAELVKFGNIAGATFERALKAAADWAAFSGQDIQNAANQIGVALSSEEKGLGRLERALGGLTHAQQDYIEGLLNTGQLQEAQAEKLRIIESRVQGVAYAMTQGLSGALKDVSKQWGEFLENVGKTSTQAGPVEMTLRGLASLLRDLGNLSKEFTGEKDRNPIRQFILDIVDTEVSILRWIPFAGGLIEKLREIQRLGQTSTGKIKELGEDEASKSAAAAQAQASEDRQRMIGRKNEERWAKEDAAARQKAAEKAQRDLEEQLKKGVMSEEEAAIARFDIAQQLYIDIGQIDKKAVEERIAAEIRAIHNEEEAYIALTDAVNEAYIAQGQIANRLRLDKIADDARAAERAAANMGTAIANAFADAIIEGEKFSDVLKGLAKDILRILSQRFVSGPIATGIAAGIARIFGQAEGGPVSAGNPYIVGEKGPELFVPSRHGQIIPNDALSSMGSGGGVTVNVNISTGVAATVRSEIAQMLPAIQRATTAGVADARFRGSPGLA